MKKFKSSKMQEINTHTANTLVVDIKDHMMNKIDDFQMTLSAHSNESLIERNISYSAIELALIYGKAFFKQGLVFYVLGEQNIPDLVGAQVRKKCKNLVVVTAGDSDEIITSYRNNNPFKYIKKKSKRLSKHKYAA